MGSWSANGFDRGHTVDTLSGWGAFAISCLYKLGSKIIQLRGLVVDP